MLKERHNVGRQKVVALSDKVKEKSYRMIMEKRKLRTVLLETFIFIVSVFIIFGREYGNSIEGFQKISAVGVWVLLFQIVVYISYEKTLITPFFIVLICFILFQFGLPILYALIPDFYNFYVEYLDVNTVVAGAKFSIIAIEAFIIGGILGAGRGKGIINLDKNYLKNERMIQQIAKILFWLTGAIAIPVSFIVLRLSMLYGYQYVKLDTMGLYNGATNFAKTMFVASAFLTIVYSTGRQKTVYSAILLLYCALSMASGGRTEGLPVLLAFILMLASKKGKKNNVTKYIIIAVVSLVMLYVLAYLAQTRVGNSYDTKSILDVVVDVVEEMGFNFTSICFTMKYIPNSTAYQFGGSYFGSLVCLIPQSLDITGVVNNIHSMLPEIWLAKQLSVSYGTLFNFGAGYSVIAESFFNFGWAGIIVVGVQGFLIQKLFALKLQGNSKFAEYIQLVMVYGLTTYSRRSFYTLEKVIEYDILLVVIIIYLGYYIVDRKRGIGNGQ